MLKRLYQAKVIIVEREKGLVSKTEEGTFFILAYSPLHAYLLAKRSMKKNLPTNEIAIFNKPFRRNTN